MQTAWATPKLRRNNIFWRAALNLQIYTNSRNHHQHHIENGLNEQFALNLPIFFRWVYLSLSNQDYCFNTTYQSKQISTSRYEMSMWNTNQDSVSILTSIHYWLFLWTDVTPANLISLFVHILFIFEIPETEHRAANLLSWSWIPSTLTKSLTVLRHPFLSLFCLSLNFPWALLQQSSYVNVVAHRHLIRVAIFKILFNLWTIDVHNFGLHYDIFIHMHDVFIICIPHYLHLPFFLLLLVNFMTFNSVIAILTFLKITISNMR